MKKKVYKISSSKSFIFNQIFLSSSFENFVNSLNKDVEFENLFLKTSSLKELNNLEKGFLGKIRFKGKFNGVLLIHLPKKFLKKIDVRKREKAYDFTSNFLDSAAGMLNVLDDEFTDWEIVRFAKFKPNKNLQNNYRLLKIEFPLSKDSSEYKFSVFLTVAFIRRLEKYFTGDSPSKKVLIKRIIDIDREFIKHVREIKSRRKEILNKKFSDKHSFKTEYVEFNDLVKLNDNEIRILLEELTNRRLSDRDLVLALSSSSDELRAKFLKNMSKNRKKELSEGFFLFDGNEDEKLRVQKEVLYILVEMIKSERLHFRKEIEDKLLKLSEKLKREAVSDAMSYLKSGEFYELIKKLKNRQIQLLIRRVNRKILILSLLGGNRDIRKKFIINMNNELHKIVKEDVEYWKREISDEDELKIHIADAQKVMVKKGEKIIEDEKKLMNVNLAR